MALLTKWQAAGVAILTQLYMVEPGEYVALANQVNAACTNLDELPGFLEKLKKLMEDAADSAVIPDLQARMDELFAFRAETFYQSTKWQQGPSNTIRVTGGSDNRLTLIGMAQLELLRSSGNGFARCAECNCPYVIRRTAHRFCSVRCKQRQGQRIRMRALFSKETSDA